MNEDRRTQTNLKKKVTTKSLRRVVFSAPIIHRPIDQYRLSVKQQLQNHNSILALSVE